MADKIQGFNIELGLDTLGVDAGLKDLNRTMTRVNSEMNRSLSAFGKGEQSMSRYESTLNGLNSKLEVQDKIVQTNKRNYDALSRTYEDNRKKLDRSARTVDEAQKNYDELSKSGNATKEELDAAAKAVEDAEREFGELNTEVNKTRKELDQAEISLNNSERAYNNIQGSIDKTTQRMKEFEYEQRMANDSLMNFGRGMEDRGRQLTEFGNHSYSAGKKLTASLTAPIIALGAFSVKTGMEFSKSMSNVQAVSGATSEDMELLENAAREMGAQSSKSASEAADALGYMALAGWDTTEMMEGLEPIIRLSEAGNIDLARASDLVTDSMSALQLETKDLPEFLDMVSFSSANANTSIDELMEGFLVSGGLATELGIPLEDLAMGLSVFADNGYKGAQGGTAFNAIITNLTAPTGRAEKALDELNVTAFDSEGNFKGLSTVIGDVQDATEGMTDEQKTQYLSMIAGKEHIKTFTSWMNLSKEEMDEMSASIKDSDNALNDMSDTMRDNLSGDWENLKSTLEAFRLEIWDRLEPAIRDITQKATDMVDAFMELDPKVQNQILLMGGLAASIGPAAMGLGLFLKTVGPLVTAGGKLIQFLRKGQIAAAVFGGGAAKAAGSVGVLGGGVAKAGGALALLSNPIGWVVGGLALLTGGFVLAYNKVDWFKNSVDLAWDTMKIFGEAIYEMSGLSWLADQFGSAWQATEDFRNGVSTTMDVVGDAIGDTFNEKVVEPFENFKAMHREAGESVEVFQGDVSEATQKILEEYVNLSEQAKLSLDELYFTQEEVTDEMVTDVKEKYEQMNVEAQTKLEERRVSELEKLQQLFDESDALNETERERAIEKLNAHYYTEQDNLESKNERIQNIITHAMEEEGGLQAHHYEQIEMLQENHNEATVTKLSQGEVEQQAILERMSTNQLATSEETVNQLISDSEKAKNKTVDEAQQKRDEIVAEAIRQRDETGNLSAEEAQRIIDEAETQYNETVKTAEDKHRDVVAEAAAQAKEHGIIVDEETGDILTSWDVFKRDFETVTKAIVNIGKNQWDDMWSGIMQYTEDGVNAVVKAYNWLMDKLGLDGLKMNRVNITGYSSNTDGNYTRLPAYAQGTNYHPGGLALVNDGGGPEIIESPDGQMYMPEGRNVLVDMEEGSTVYPHRVTRDIINNMIPAYKDGVGGWRERLDELKIVSGALANVAKKKTAETLGKGAAQVVGKVSNIMSYATDPSKLAGTLLEQFGMKNPFTGLHGEILSHMFKNFTGGLTDKFKEMFAASAAPMPGILDPSRISYEYGHTAKYTNETGRYWHSGVDFPFVYQPVKTPISGTLTQQPFDSGGYGRWATVKNGNTSLVFAHLDSFGTVNGAQVSAGDVIGKSGNTGFSTGPHLHFEYRKNGKAQNPRPWLEGAFRGSYAAGGIIDKHGIYEGAEGNKPEMVIPLTNRTRAIDLMLQAMDLMNLNQEKQYAGGSNSREMLKALMSQLKNQKEMIAQYDEMINLMIQMTSKEWKIDKRSLVDGMALEMKKKMDYIARREGRFNGT